MNTQSYPATRNASADECVAIGDFIYDDERRYLYIVPPDVSGRPALDSTHQAALDAIAIHRHASEPGLNGHRSWLWDGNEDKPTLTPSIHYLDNWHGYLTAGQLVSC